VGRFISEDPIGLAGGINVYVYAGNSPTNLRDPMGLSPRKDQRSDCEAKLESEGATNEMVKAVCGGGVLLLPPLGGEHPYAKAWAWTPRPTAPPPAATGGRTGPGGGGGGGDESSDDEPEKDLLNCANDVFNVALSLTGAKLGVTAGRFAANQMREQARRIYLGGNQAGARTLLLQARRTERALPWNLQPTVGLQALSTLPVIGGGFAAYAATTCIMENW
jgi:hypothetical protein